MVKYVYFTSMSGLLAMHIHNKIQHKDEQIRHSRKSKVKTNSKRTGKTNGFQLKARPGLMLIRLPIPLQHTALTVIFYLSFLVLR